jgi:hypothetical protein
VGVKIVGDRELEEQIIKIEITAGVSHNVEFDDEFATIT